MDFERDVLGQQLEQYFENVAENCTTKVSVTLHSTNSSDSRNFHLGTNIDAYMYIVYIQFKDDIHFADRLIDFHDSMIVIPSSGFSEHEPVEINNTNFRFRYFSPERQRKHAAFSTELEIPPFAYQQSTFDATIVVSQFLKCEMIELNLEDFDVKRNKSGVYFQELNLFLSNKDFIESNKSNIRVCARDYMHYAKNVVRDTRPSIINMLSIVCVCLSVVSLIVTLVVYGLLTELRTQPGLNNMFLSISLLAAFIGLFIGGIQSISGFWCSIIGLLVHFLWLNSVFWLNVCCYHMFRTFGTMRVPVAKKTSWMYHVYCLVSSTVLVNINIIWSLTISDGKIIGYGKHSSVCYIFYPYMVGYTMTLPVGIVVASNIVMYVTVIYKIRKDSFRTSCQTSRKHFSIYIKLSTVTGVSWLSYIPAIMLRNKVSDAIVSVLVACQGVYIMLAFVCNIRVLHLFKAFILERRELSINSTTSINRNKPQEKTFVVNKERGTTTSLV